jgi:hypothetical protein
LLATLSKSLQFNFSILKLFLGFVSSGLNWGSIDADLLKTVHGLCIERAGKNLYFETQCFEALQRIQRFFDNIYFILFDLFIWLASSGRSVKEQPRQLV